MDSQPTPPNIPPAGERPSGLTPEDLHAEAPGSHAGEAAPSPMPQPGGGEPAQASVAVPPTLSASDVAAAVGLPTSPAQGTAVSGPAAAGDVDVIEAEWVDKAEDVVRKTQGDPYREEEDIEDLQQDYLMKRYGHKVADPKVDDSKPEGT